MDDNQIIIIATVVSFILVWFLIRGKVARKFISGYVFPSLLSEWIAQEYGEENVELIEESLREYFLVLQRANNVKFFVPSKVLLTVWQKFITLDKYKKFSKRAFRGVITPPKQIKNVKKRVVNNAFKTLWSITKANSVNSGENLPKLFTLDKRLEIKNPYTYKFRKKKKKKRNRAKRVKQNVRYEISYSCETGSGSWDMDDVYDYTVRSESEMSDTSDNVSESSSDSNSSSSSSSHSSDSDGGSSSDSGSSSSSDSSSD